MTRSHILHMLTPLKHMSPFDVNMAVDAGFDAMVPYMDVTLDEVTGLVQDAIFSRPPDDGVARALHRRQGAPLALDMMDAAKKAPCAALPALPLRRPGRLLHHRRRPGRRSRRRCARLRPQLEDKRVASSAAPASSPSAPPCSSRRKAPGRGWSATTARARPRSPTRCRSASASRSRLVDGSTDARQGAAVREADVILSAAAAGVQVLAARPACERPSLLVAADVNAVPPAGIEGSPSTRRRAAGWASALGIGALTVGNVKYQTESGLFNQMLATEKPVAYDFRDAYPRPRHRRLAGRRSSSPPSPAARSRPRRGGRASRLVADLFGDTDTRALAARLPASPATCIRASRRPRSCPPWKPWPPANPAAVVLGSGFERRPDLIAPSTAASADRHRAADDRRVKDPPALSAASRPLGVPHPPISLRPRRPAGWLRSPSAAPAACISPRRRTPRPPRPLPPGRVEGRRLSRCSSPTGAGPRWSGSAGSGRRPRSRPLPLRRRGRLCRSIPAARRSRRLPGSPRRAGLAGSPAPTSSTDRDGSLARSTPAPAPPSTSSTAADAPLLAASGGGLGRPFEPAPPPGAWPRTASSTRRGRSRRFRPGLARLGRRPQPPGSRGSRRRPDLHRRRDGGHAAAARRALGRRAAALSTAWQGAAREDGCPASTPRRGPRRRARREAERLRIAPATGAGRAPRRRGRAGERRVEAGRRLAEICLGGLGAVSLVGDRARRGGPSR